ncbi:DNA-binding response regulator, OmpR family, contains REC and winged-helix (wHTH) domain [Geosporobacter subterraneus DSM 17957]|uniref:Heme response regulator HssR n=1 Tax=Geosporobacter subterraneus DSM 17957 TaxID=1121919 RepID=A0A1M6DM53_9FIRM|nr:response regulator transcription factor [Geosporobacter subterraneus]SHI74233.1 DNA-binding response regulator, OmpR family, contains REC and winged-helix (wHTH) domain [Geosporobacter subterraneus DSM 17957]
MASKKILVIEDDYNIYDLISIYLKKEGYDVLGAQDGEKGLSVFREEAPDLVVLDIMLPKMDGWDLCREIKKISDIPIIMLTAKGETFDKVLGLKLGADDYMVKPFDPKELIARIDAVLRRYHKGGQSAKQVVLPNLTVDLEGYTVRIQNEILELPPKEMELLYFLVKNQNRVFTREQLIENIWGYDFEGELRTIDVHIKRLREKLRPLEDQYKIKTLWGVGYKFEVGKHA